MEATVNFSKKNEQNKKIAISYSTALWLMFFVTIGVQCPMFGNDADMVAISNKFITILYSGWVRTIVATISGFMAIMNYLKGNAPVQLVFWALMVVAMGCMPQLIKFFVGT